VRLLRRGDSSARRRRQSCNPLERFVRNAARGLDSSLTELGKSKPYRDQKYYCAGHDHQRDAAVRDRFPRNVNTRFASLRRHVAQKPCQTFLGMR